MIKYRYYEIEAHLTKSNPPWMPPRLWEKGVSAEADAVACIFAGSTDKIRPAVAYNAKGYHSINVICVF
jgi:hypothetical protein